MTKYKVATRAGWKRGFLTVEDAVAYEARLRARDGVFRAVVAYNAPVQVNDAVWVEVRDGGLGTARPRTVVESVVRVPEDRAGYQVVRYRGARYILRGGINRTFHQPGYAGEGEDTVTDLSKFDLAAMRAVYGGAPAWTDAEVYADYTTYRGPAPLLRTPVSAEQVATFVQACQSIVDASYGTGKRLLSITEGQRYLRVVAKDAGHEHGSVYCFIDRETGDVLKSASWKAPAKGARGNILAADGGVSRMTAYGAGYNR